MLSPRAGRAFLGEVDTLRETMTLSYAHVHKLKKMFKGINPFGNKMNLWEPSSKYKIFENPFLPLSSKFLKSVTQCPFVIHILFLICLSEPQEMLQKTHKQMCVCACVRTHTCVKDLSRASSRYPVGWSTLGTFLSRMLVDQRMKVLFPD